ncbi:hypothetical protein BCV69DRAFT_310673 [Microstroma glucosiphilum]|uniref:2-oxoisovalerate dehydrogenase subunit alpha n=1 Tax=Pseudomicrostroma glucosiphilum TaxID=1684307 RepID=A0A316UD80_9BASI|nr:hypothetical protein BCV69DRAFT_310673 [Pseudomicrostroma glucosiphilum]PWN23197.1 hypothetical protein BCV69DRAFT_310673 [Pseudomicrostroma glucosiphilum]
MFTLMAASSASSSYPMIWRAATNSHRRGVRQTRCPSSLSCSHSSPISCINGASLPQRAKLDLNPSHSLRHLSTSSQRHHPSPTSSHSASSPSSSRRPPPAPSKLASGHLPNKPGSAFLSDLDDCFFDQMRVWKDKAGNELTEIPTFRLLDGKGRAVSKEAEARVEELSKEEALQIYRYMMLLPQLDQVLYSAQRQGRISFWMTSYGEEAAVIGTAAALSSVDEVYSQYRELGLLLYRGLPLDQLLAQVFGTHMDKGKARQMPTHIGSSEHHFHTISSPLSTQIPQAAGSAYALKRTPGREGDVVACWFGEGASSEGDFHAGLNIASTLHCPVLWLARNNGFAISTPATEQYRGDGIASRGPGYGTLTIRVDGNDVLAVKVAVAEAKKRALRESRPVLIELMTYRIGHHSTSDDSGSYRPTSSVEEWSKLDNPLHRFRAHLLSRSWWDSSSESSLIASHRKSVLQALSVAEKAPQPDPFETLFEDTWKEKPRVLEEQKRELRRLVEKYGEGWEPWRKALEKVKKG